MMNHQRGCILGLFQFGLMLCLTGGLVVAIVSWSIWQEAGDLSAIWRQLNRSKSLTGGEAIIYQSTLPAVLPQTQNIAPAPTMTPVVVMPTPTDFPTPSPRTAPATPAPPSAPALPQTSAPSLTQTSPADQTGLSPAPHPTTLPSLNTSAILALPEHLATRLVIPKMALDASVILAPIAGETWEVNHLDQQIGHLQGTASPGSSSNVVLAGHITLAPDGRAGPFLKLNSLASGDLVTVYYGDQPFTYRIDHIKTVKPTDIQVTYPSNDSKLTLITCLNYNRALGRYEDRLVAVGYLEQGE